MYFLSLCTRQAYVVCDEETFDDEIFMYFDGEEARAAAKKLADEKTPVTAGRIEGKQLLMFYTSLHTMGINAIVVREGENETLIQLEELVKRIEQPEGKVWVENPSLHLTALYFMQEFRKQPNQQITGQMRQLQEEIAANFEKARFIMAVSTEEKGLPLVKLNNGDVFQPVFTDVLEFQKFNRENKFRPVVIESQKLPGAGEGGQGRGVKPHRHQHAHASQQTRPGPAPGGCAGTAPAGGRSGESGDVIGHSHADRIIGTFYL